MRIYWVFQGRETVREFGPETTQIVIGRPRNTMRPFSGASVAGTAPFPSASSHTAIDVAPTRVLPAAKPVPNVVPLDIDLSPDLTVSRPHARLVLQDEIWHIEDLDSTHGTRLNDAEIRGQGSFPLHRGDYLAMGETVLRWEIPVEIAEPAIEIGTVIDAQTLVPTLLRPAASGAESARRLALLYELPLQFAGESSLESLLQTIVRRLVEVIPDAARGALLLLPAAPPPRNLIAPRDAALSQQDTTPIVSREAASHAPATPELPEAATDQRLDETGWEGEGVLWPQAYFPVEETPAISRTLARRAIEEREGFIWKRGEGGPTENSNSILHYHLQTGMYAPLMWQGRALGAVCVDNAQRGGAFDQDDLRIVLMVAQYAAMAVANNQLQSALRDAWKGTLDALTSALASRDSETQSHCYRSVELAVALSRQLGLDALEIAPIARGALLHDIGKIGIADEILLKPGHLTIDERERMKQHVQLGHDMLCHIPFFQDALPVVLYHHENFDGSGYLHGLRGEQIPRGARIFHVVDLYDALTQNRPYKTAWSHEEALAELQRLSGTRCDPEVVRALSALDRSQLQAIGCATGFSPDVSDLLGRGNH